MMFFYENNCSFFSDIFFFLKKDYINFLYFLKVILRLICKILINGYFLVCYKRFDFCS